MYGHGFATLFLGEVYGMTGNEEVKEKLQKAVQLMRRLKTARAAGDISRRRMMPISVSPSARSWPCTARDAGIKVEKEVIDRSIEYVKGCQNPDGGFAYQRQMRGSGSGYARTAAGVASLYYSGIFDGDEIARGLKYLKQYVPGRNPEQAMDGMYFYGNYYGVQAMFLAGGEYWSSFYPTIRDQLITRQNNKTGTGKARPATTMQPPWH